MSRHQPGGIILPSDIRCPGERCPDIILAASSGGEHAAYNLVPTHRKCNEVKGSEKAQNRARAIERWLGEWATSHKGATPRAAVRHHAHVGEPAALPVG